MNMFLYFHVEVRFIFYGLKWLLYLFYFILFHLILFYFIQFYFIYLFFIYLFILFIFCLFIYSIYLFYSILFYFFILFYKECFIHFETWCKTFPNLLRLYSNFFLLVCLIKICQNLNIKNEFLYEVTWYRL